MSRNLLCAALDAAEARDQILTQIAGSLRPVEMPEWGVTVFVRKMIPPELAAFQQWIRTTGRSNFTAKLITAATTDEQGALIFSKDDAEALGRTSSVALRRISAAILELHGGSLAPEQHSPEGAPQERKATADAR